MTIEEFEKKFEEAEAYHDANFEKLARHLDLDGRSAEALIELYNSFDRNIPVGQFYQLQAKVNIMLKYIVETLVDDAQEAKDHE